MMGSARMSDIMTRPIKALLTSGALVALAGCVNLGGDLPDSLLTLTAAPASAESSPNTSGAALGALAVAPIQAPARLDVARVPVTVSDTEIAYLKDAVWVEKPARLFRRLVAETIRTGTGRVVIDGDVPSVATSDRLHGTLREFGYDARSSSAIVVFDAIRKDADGQIKSQRFESRVSGVSAEVEDVSSALNQAANDVAGQVANWIG